MKREENHLVMAWLPIALEHEPIEHRPEGPSFFPHCFCLFLPRQAQPCVVEYYIFLSAGFCTVVNCEFLSYLWGDPYLSQNLKRNNCMNDSLSRDLCQVLKCLQKQQHDIFWGIRETVVPISEISVFSIYHLK